MMCKIFRSIIIIDDSLCSFTIDSQTRHIFKVRVILSFVFNAVFSGNCKCHLMACLSVSLCFIVPVSVNPNK